MGHLLVHGIVPNCIVSLYTHLQFSQREAQRKLQELSVADRIVLNTAMALVSNQTGRK